MSLYKPFIIVYVYWVSIRCFDKNGRTGDYNSLVDLMDVNLYGEFITNWVFCELVIEKLVVYV